MATEEQVRTAYRKAVQEVLGNVGPELIAEVLIKADEVPYVDDLNAFILAVIKATQPVLQNEIDRLKALIAANRADAESSRALLKELQEGARLAMLFNQMSNTIH